MKRLSVEKTVVALVLTACWLWLPVTGYRQGECEGADVLKHLLYMFSHVNVWHLLGNLFVMWLIRSGLHLVPSLAIGFLCSFLPAFGLWPIGMTVGFSGVLFAAFGINWGIHCRREDAKGKEEGDTALIRFLTRIVPFALIGILIPHVNWCLHIYCLMAGFVYGRYNNI